MQKKSNRKPPPPGPGRPKGVPNKTTTQLKEAILEAATAAGKGSLTAYLETQAKENPGHFMTLLGKVLPMTIAGDQNAPIRHLVEWLSPTEK